jgi:hypothetical protein
MATSFICQACGIEAPTKAGAYYQNIGALVVRYHKRVQGNLCKRCHHKFFWKFTATNLTLGWWGYISLLVTPFFVLNNIARYAATLPLAKTPPDAKKPELTAAMISKLDRHRAELIKRLNAGETLETVAPDLSRRAGVTPGEIVIYLQWVVAHQKEQNPQTYVPPPKAQGFPVQPAAGRQPVEPLPAIPLEPEDQPGA